MCSFWRDISRLIVIQRWGLRASTYVIWNLCDTHSLSLFLRLSPTLLQSSVGGETLKAPRNAVVSTFPLQVIFLISPTQSLSLSFLPYGWNPLYSLNPRVSLTLCLFLFAPFIIINMCVLCKYDGPCFLTEGWFRESRIKWVQFHANIDC